MCALSAARIQDATQDFLDMAQGGGRIEYDETDYERMGDVGSVLLLMTVRCPHCDEPFEIEYDPQEFD